MKVRPLEHHLEYCYAVVQGLIDEYIGKLLLLLYNINPTGNREESNLVSLLLPY